MKLNNILEANDDLKFATEAWLSALKRETRGSQTDPVEVLHGEGRAAIRDYGRWENPPEARGEEDYDWQELSAKSHQDLEKSIKDMAKSYPKLKFTYTTGEKNWLYLHVKR